MTNVTDKLRELDKQIEQKNIDTAEREIKKEMAQMEREGAYDDPDEYDEEQYKNGLLEEYEVFETKIDQNGNAKKLDDYNFDEKSVTNSQRGETSET